MKKEACNKIHVIQKRKHSKIKGLFVPTIFCMSINDKVKRPDFEHNYYNKVF